MIKGSVILFYPKRSTTPLLLLIRKEEKNDNITKEFYVCNRSHNNKSLLFFTCDNFCNFPLKMCSYFTNTTINLGEYDHWGFVVYWSKLMPKKKLQWSSVASWEFSLNKSILSGNVWHVVPHIIQVEAKIPLSPCFCTRKIPWGTSDSFSSQPRGNNYYLRNYLVKYELQTIYAKCSLGFIVTCVMYSTSHGKVQIIYWK